MIPDLHKFEEPNHKTCNFPLFYYVFVIETLGMVAMLQKVVPKTNALAAKSWRQQPFTPEIPHPSVTTTMSQSIHHRTNPSGKGRRTILARPRPAWLPVGQVLEGNPWRRGPRLSPDHWAGVKMAYSAHRAMGALRLQRPSWIRARSHARARDPRGILDGWIHSTCAASCTFETLADSGGRAPVRISERAH